MFVKYHKIIAFCLLITFLICFSINSFAQDEEIIDIKTDLITVPVTVLDRQGRYITNLKKENFQILENSIEQKISFFEPVNQPLTVFLLLDQSGSMDKQIPKLALASNSLINRLRPDDKVFIALFDDSVKTVAKAIKVRDLKTKGKIDLRRTKRSPKVTMVYDAVEKALEKINKNSGRKAIILFSDGVGSGYFASAKSNLRDAEESEALIYSVQFNTYPKIAPKYVNKKEYYKKIKKADNYMSELARVTGGKHFQFYDISKLKESFESIANELGQQYQLGYYPKETGKKDERREIKVKVNIPNVAVRARKSYIVGSYKK